MSGIVDKLETILGMLLVLFVFFVKFVAIPVAILLTINYFLAIHIPITFKSLLGIILIRIFASLG